MSEIEIAKLPETLQKFIRRYPNVWESHVSLGTAAKEAGPLSEKEIQLIKLTVAGSEGLETPFKTHVHLAGKAGASKEEIEHAIIVTLPMQGMGRTMRAMKWLDEASMKNGRTPQIHLVFFRAVLACSSAWSEESALLQTEFSSLIADNDSTSQLYSIYNIDR